MICLVETDVKSAASREVESPLPPGVVHIREVLPEVLARFGVLNVEDRPFSPGPGAWNRGESHRLVRAK